MAPFFGVEDGYLRFWISFLYLLCCLFGRFICCKPGLQLAVSMRGTVARVGAESACLLSGAGFLPRLENFRCLYAAITVNSSSASRLTLPVLEGSSTSSNASSARSDTGYPSRLHDALTAERAGVLESSCGHHIHSGGLQTIPSRSRCNRSATPACGVRYERYASSCRQVGSDHGLAPGAKQIKDGGSTIVLMVSV